MSDIGIHISWLDLLLASPVFGWPGLIIGGALGGFFWRRRRIVGAVLGASVGCVVWFAASLLLK
ncbi:MAG: hypothetical protein WDN76_01885 [Alphaproteobacteria bacterium]